MATARQTEANRRNAAGPHKMSEEGKAAVRGNAIRHGLATKIHVVLPGEDQSLFKNILESLHTEYAPSTTQQELLVHQIAQNYWRLARARNMETGSLKMSINLLAEEFGLEPAEPGDELRGANQATAMAKHDAIFNRITRYEAAAESAPEPAIYTTAEIEEASLTMSPADFEAFLDRLTTPAHQKAAA